MNRRSSALFGFLLIVIGGLALAYNFVSPWLVWNFAWLPWRLWPLSVILMGLCFVIPALISQHRGVGGLFLPGIPILALGCILLFNSIFNAWGVWAWVWPVVILALAMGFLCAAWKLRNIWLLIPGVIIGANGLLLLFCAITGQWTLWAVLWGIEPFAVGLALLLVNIQKRRPGLLKLGLILCAVAGFATLGMSIIIPGWLWVNLFGSSLILFVGFIMLLNSLARNTQQRQITVEG